MTTRTIPITTVNSHTTRNIIDQIPLEKTATTRQQRTQATTWQHGLRTLVMLVNSLAMSVKTLAMLG